MNREDAITILIILGLYFLFDGTPDVWDSFHNMAIGACQKVK